MNPHNIPLNKLIYKKDTKDWECPLKVNLGPDAQWKDKDGIPSIRIAELYAPDKCTYICHHSHFKEVSDLTKRILLGEFKDPQTRLDFIKD